MKGDKKNLLKENRKKEKQKIPNEIKTSTRFDLSKFKLFVSQKKIEKLIINTNIKKEEENPKNSHNLKRPIILKQNYYFLNSFNQKKNENYQNNSDLIFNDNFLSKNNNLKKKSKLNKSENKNNLLNNKKIDEKKNLCYDFENIDNLSSCSNSSFEKVSKAFGYESSYTKTGKIQSSNLSSEIENPEIAKSMRDEEIRTLSFLEEEDEIKSETILIKKKRNVVKLKKNKLKYNKSKFEKFQRMNSEFATKIKLKKNDHSIFSTLDSRQKCHSFNFYNNQKEKINNYLNNSTNPNAIYLEEIEEINEITDNNSNYQNYSPLLYNNIKNNNQNALALQEHNYYKTIYPIKKNDNNKIINDSSSIKRKRNSEPVKDDTKFKIKKKDIISKKKCTLMIRNIPNKYTKELMIKTIDKKFIGKYDFFYLPIDFKRHCNVGYAFINFIDVCVIQEFYETFHNKKWGMFNSEKICEIAYARIQGKIAMEEHFKNSSLMKQPDQKYKPFICQNRKNIMKLISSQKKLVKK